MRVALLAICLAASLSVPVALTVAAEEETYFPIQPPADPDVLGRGVQRTMTLLATSTPTHRNNVRILFYGQSITEQEWSQRVADDLRRRFPHADLDIQNRAIGGFASQWLVRPAEHDLYPFYPDLLIFHVYGANQQYEEIIRNVRSRTTAEVLMQKDHVTAWPPAVPDENKDKGAWWDHMMNHVFLPAIAQKYGCTLIDIRGAWLDYLKANQLEPSQLLKDGVHLNDHGNYLLAELVKRHLVYRPDLPADPWRDLVRDIEVGTDIAWKDGRLSLDFEGNRVDVVCDADNAVPTAQVLIDGKKPSAFPECYCITRPQPGPWSPLFVSRVDREQPLLIEDWLLRVTSASDDGKSWTFDVTGSVTGEDGSGTNSEPFVSRSGRVKINPDAWFAPGKVPSGYEARWQVRPMFADTIPAVEQGQSPVPVTTTVAQGLSNTRHRLEIVGQTPIRTIRVYRPPVQ